MAKVKANGRSAKAERMTQMGLDSESAITIPGISIKRLSLTIVGDSPLVCHRWSKKAKQEMLDKQMKKAKQARTAKHPWMDYCQSMYWISAMPKEPTQKDIDAATFGVPAIAFKSAAVDACSQIDGMKKVFARGAFHVDGQIVEIDGKPIMREDMVRVGMGTADIRHRGEFTEWSCVLTISYNSNAISAEQIANLFNVAGFSIGVGEGRPQKDRDWGRFHVA